MPEPTRLEHEPKIIWPYRQLEAQIQARLFKLLGDKNIAKQVMSNPTDYQAFVGRVREAMTRTLVKKFNLGYYRGDEDGLLTRVHSPQDHS